MSEKIELAITAHYRAQCNFICLDDAPQYHVNIQTEFIGECIGLGEDEPAGQIELGTLDFTLIRVGVALEDRIPFIELFDETQDTYDLAEAIFEGSYEDYVPEIARQFPEANTYGDLMFFTHIGLRPVARGVRLGLAVVYKAIQDWASGCSLVVMNPYPLQNGQLEPDGGEWAELDLKQFTDSFGDARQRLIAYYSQLGFKPAGDNPYIFFDPCIQQPRASRLRFPETIFVDRQHLS
jgi:hypothetical protein